MESMKINDWISLLSQLLVVGGLIFAALKFAQEKKREFQKRFFEEQLRIYSEAVDYASITCVYEKTDEKYIDARNNFNRLFWGKMCIVEDRVVQKKMEHFKKLLDNYDAENNLLKLNHIRKKLGPASVAIAHSCRNSSIKTWELKIAKGFNDYSSSNSETDPDKPLELRENPSVEDASKS